MVEAVLLAILVTVLLMTILTAVLVGVFSWQMAKSNRVVPDSPTTAPLLWLWSPTVPARMHRRLRAAARPLPTPPSGRRARTGGSAAPHTQLSATVVGQAVAVDLELVRASRLSRPQRRRHLAHLAPQVDEIERLSLRLQQQQRLAAQPADIGGPHRIAPTTPEVLAGVSGQLDRLDEAHRELTAIERESGLLDPDEVLGRIAPPALTATPPPPRPAPAGRSARPAPRPSSAPRRSPPAPPRRATSS